MLLNINYGNFICYILLNVLISDMMMDIFYVDYGVGFFFKLLWKVVCVFIIYLVFIFFEIFEWLFESFCVKYFFEFVSNS